MKCLCRAKERGATLLELLAALVIIAFIAITFTAFFTQSQLFTNKTEEKVDIVNLNQYILYEAVEMLKKEHIEILQDREENNSYFDFLEEGGSGYYVSANNGERFYPDISVHQGEISDAGNLQTLLAYHVRVSLKDENNEYTSHLYQLVYESELEEEIN